MKFGYVAEVIPEIVHLKSVWFLMGILGINVYPWLATVYPDQVLQAQEKEYF